MVKQQLRETWISKCPICSWQNTFEAKEVAQSELREHIISKHRGAAPPKMPPENIVKHVEPSPHP